MNSAESEQPRMTLKQSKTRRLLTGAVGTIQYVWLLLGLVLALLVGVEILANFAWGMLFAETGDPRSKAPCYADAAWVNEYFEEFAATKTCFSPLTHWRRIPFAGQYVTVDRQGHRAGHRPEAVARKDLPEIWVFGGSTIWGTGARDEETIPSWISRSLEADGHPHIVRNFGESGYVSSQEIVLLIEKLRQHTAPRAIIFYDGVNDSYAAWQSGDAGAIQNRSHREHEYNLLAPGNSGRLAAASVWSLIRDSKTKAIVRRAIGERQYSDSLDSRAAQQLSQSVAENYELNMRTVQAIAERAGANVYFFWQPTVFARTTPSSYEKGVQEKYSRTSLPSMFAEASEAFRTRGVGEQYAFTDLTLLLSDEDGSPFIDFCHVSEDANRLIALAILKELEID